MSRQQPGLGAEFLLCVEEVFARLNRTPEMYEEVYRGVRRALTRRFPYAVYYRVEGDEVVVLGSRGWATTLLASVRRRPRL